MSTDTPRMYLLDLDVEHVSTSFKSSSMPSNLFPNHSLSYPYGSSLLPLVLALVRTQAIARTAHRRHRGRHLTVPARPAPSDLQQPHETLLSIRNPRTF